MRPLDELFEKDAGMGDPVPVPEAPQQPKSPKPSVTPELIGSAVGGPALGWSVGQIKKTLSSKSDEDIQREAVMDLMDPAHEAELTKIKTQAMLSEFMATDPVISTYDPDELAMAYNQVVQLTPRAATQPVIMRGLLRRFLQQSDALEPHEASQLAGIESTLKGLGDPAKAPLMSLDPGGKG